MMIGIIRLEHLFTTAKKRLGAKLCLLYYLFTYSWIIFLQVQELRIGTNFFGWVCLN
jgi:hypothetical protein